MAFRSKTARASATVILLGAILSTYAALGGSNFYITTYRSRFEFNFDFDIKGERCKCKCPCEDPFPWCAEKAPQSDSLAYPKMEDGITRSYWSASFGGSGGGW
jgi:hypothetical protein